MVDHQHLMLLLRTHTVVRIAFVVFFCKYLYILFFLDSPSSSTSSSTTTTTTTTTLPRYKTLLDKFTPTIPSSLPSNEQQSTTVTTAASIVSNSNTLIRNYYENLCNNSSTSNSITSSTSTNNRKKRSISNEYDFSSTNSMINDGRSLPKRFRPIQSSTGNLF